MNLPRELAERLLPAAVNSLNCPSVEQVEAVIREAMQLALEAAEQACEKAEGWRSDFDVSRPGIREAIRSLKPDASSRPSHVAAIQAAWKEWNKHRDAASFELLEQAISGRAVLPVGESPAAAPQNVGSEEMSVADEFCLRCGQHFECAKEKWAHDCPVINRAAAPAAPLTCHVCGTILDAHWLSCPKCEGPSHTSKVSKI